MDDDGGPRGDPLPAPAGGDDGDELPVADDELPVVARMVVEIRSDGTRTVARGALEDRSTGHGVALQAEAGTPAELSAMLLKQLLTTPLAIGASLRERVAARRRRLTAGLRRRLLGGAPPDEGGDRRLPG